MPESLFRRAGWESPALWEPRKDASVHLWERSDSGGGWESHIVRGHEQKKDVANEWTFSIETSEIELE